MQGKRGEVGSQEYLPLPQAGPDTHAGRIKSMWLLLQPNGHIVRPGESYFQLNGRMQLPAIRFFHVLHTE